MHINPTGSRGTGRWAPRKSAGDHCLRHLSPLSRRETRDLRTTFCRDMGKKLVAAVRVDSPFDHGDPRALFWPARWTTPAPGNSLEQATLIFVPRDEFHLTDKERKPANTQSAVIQGR